MGNKSKTLRKVRTLRHWKQRFDKNAKFIWRRPKIYQGKKYHPGDVIPQELVRGITKLRRFWESGVIELAEFEAPNVRTGKVEKPRDDDLPDEVTVEKGKGGWFLVTIDGEIKKVRGSKKLEELLATLRE